MKKTAIVIFSDPASKSDEALGRLFNAMILTYELKEKNEDVVLIFQGAATRWPSEIVKSDHPANALFKAIEDKVLGVCGGCADIFGATDNAKSSGLSLIHEKEIPGTTGVIDLSKYLEDGSRLVTF